jgi:hypothetical protein
MDVKQAPNDIECSSLVFDIAFHPHADIVAAALIDGSVEMYGGCTRVGSSR